MTLIPLKLRWYVIPRGKGSLRLMDNEIYTNDDLDRAISRTFGLMKEPILDKGWQDFLGIHLRMLIDVEKERMNPPIELIIGDKKNG